MVDVSGLLHATPGCPLKVFQTVLTTVLVKFIFAVERDLTETTQGGAELRTARCRGRFTIAVHGPLRPGNGGQMILLKGNRFLWPPHPPRRPPYLSYSI